MRDDPHPCVRDERGSAVSEDYAAVVAAINAAHSVLTGTGEHTEHAQRQVGRCVFCSCGARVQGRLPEGVVERSPVYEVVLPDGFVAWRGNDQDQARAVQARHVRAQVRTAKR